MTGTTPISNGSNGTGLFKIAGDHSEFLFSEISIRVIEGVGVLPVSTVDRLGCVRDQLDVDSPVILRVMHSAQVSGVLKPVENSRHRAVWQARDLTELLRRTHVLAQHEKVQCLEIDDEQPELTGNALVAEDRVDQSILLSTLDN